MKNKLFFITLLTITYLFSGCSKDDDTTKKKTNTPTPQNVVILNGEKFKNASFSLKYGRATKESSPEKITLRGRENPNLNGMDIEIELYKAVKGIYKINKSPFNKDCSIFLSCFRSNIYDDGQYYEDSGTIEITSIDSKSITVKIDCVVAAIASDEVITVKGSITLPIISF